MIDLFVTNIILSLGNIRISGIITHRPLLAES